MKKGINSNKLAFISTNAFIKKKKERIQFVLIPNHLSSKKLVGVSHSSPL